MIPPFAIHWQDTRTNWPGMTAPLAGAKWVGDYQKLREVKQHNPGALTVFRSHREDLYHWAFTVGDPQRAAREYFAGFLDGTFWEGQFWRYIDVIEEFNEYTASSHTETEKLVRLAWLEAVCTEWNRLKVAHPNELGNGRPGGPIRLCLVNAPIGNDIDWRYAAIAAREDHWLGYHPYVLMDGGERHEADHRWHSMRWAYNDAEFVARGIRPRWLFTEGGPFLDTVAGWRDARVCGGDITTYWHDAMVPFFRDLAKTVAYNEGRTGPVFVFTASNDPTWRWYDLREDDIQYLVNQAQAFDMPAPQPPAPPAPPPPVQEPAEIKGIDVSHWQKTMDWQKVPEAGVRYAFVRATIGLAGVDNNYDVNLAGVQSTGLPYSLFHVFYNQYDPEAQASYFASKVPHDTPLPLVVDAERPDTKPADLASRMHRFLLELEELTGRKPIIYTARWWWNPYIGNTTWAKDYDLWVANYTTAAQPLMPIGWDTYRFWQYTSTGSGPAHGATSAAIDLNRFNGDEQAWQAYLESVKPRPVFDLKRFILDASAEEQRQRGIRINHKFGFEQILAARPGYAPVHNETAREAPDGKRYVFRAAEDLTGKGPRITLIYEAPWSGPGGVHVFSEEEDPLALGNPVQGIPMQITAGGNWRAPRVYSGASYEHEGIDLRAVSGSQAVPVIAAALGVVDSIRAADPGTGYGRYVRLRHEVGGETYYTWYAHLASIASGLANGQVVPAGRQLGIAGSSGNSTGIHLHFGLEWVGYRATGQFIAGDWIDPRPYLGLA